MTSPLRTKDKTVEHPITKRQIVVERAAWLPHDGTQAAQRRRRQMARGVLPTFCTTCGVTIPTGSVTPLCDACLEKKWT